MAEVAKTRESPVMLSPKALEKALVSSARRASRLAEAFGQQVPGIAVGTAKPPTKKPRKH